MNTSHNQLTCIAPCLVARDVPATLAFYRDQLGFEITFQGPEPSDIFFGIVQRGAAMIMLKDVGVDPLPNCMRDVKKGWARWDAYLYVPDPDALARAGGEFVVFPELTLTDLAMPTADGFQLISAIRRTSRTPIIVISVVLVAVYVWRAGTDELV